MLSYFDPGYFEKKHYNDFFIHKLSQPIYTPKLPMSLHRQAVNLVLLLTNGKMIKKSGLTDYTVGKNGLFLLPQGHITDTTLFNENSDGYFVHFSNNFLISKSIDLEYWINATSIKTTTETLVEFIGNIRLKNNKS